MPTRSKARLELLATTPQSWVGGSPYRPSPDAAAAIDRVAFAIPRAAARVPWRSTCLVQAIAARRWLASLGVGSQIRLGARKAGDGAIDAHAWLEADGRVIVGGETGDYRPFRISRD